MDPLELKAAISDGLLSFPLTDFDAGYDFASRAYARRLEWLMPYGASALFIAGGTGEFFSLEPGEYRGIVETAAGVCKGHVPIIAGAGGGTRLAIAYARQALEAGADGVLLMPQYLTEGTQEGLVAHVEAVCKSVEALGVIVYNRGGCQLTAASVARLAETCPNLIGFKDGVGNIEAFMQVRLTIGDRLAYVGGLPTAEIFASAYRAMECLVYSSAVFNFIPRTAMTFYRALCAGDTGATDTLLRQFFLPYIALRNQGAGYAVSIVKAGARLVGRGAGPVRPPLSDLTNKECEQLRQLIDALGPQ